MNNTSLLIENLGKENVLLDEKMSKHTSFKTGGKANIFVKIQNIDSLRYVIRFANENGLELFILGNGSNILVGDKGFSGIVCKMEMKKFEIEERNREIFVTAR